MHLASHAGGGGWPGGAGGLPPGLPGGGSLFGDGSYSGNLIQAGSLLQPVAGVLTVTGAATLAPDAVTGACVLSCDSLVLNGAAASLAPLTNSKGLIVYARTKIQLLNGARLHTDTLGRAGNFGTLTPYDLTPDSLKRTLNRTRLLAYMVRGEGAAGGAASSATGNVGLAASGLQTGGGGSGGARTNGGTNWSGAGGRGGPCCGGAGGGGVCPTIQSAGCPHDGSVDCAGGPYGGPGGPGFVHSYVSWESGGGAGDPVGTRGGGGGGTHIPPTGAGGGLLMLFAPSVSIASGCVISSDGGQGGGVVPSGGVGIGGGGAGGGCIAIVTRAGGYLNAGTVRASGGTSGPYDNAGPAGGAGGAGSVNILTAA